MKVFALSIAFVCLASAKADQAPEDILPDDQQLGENEASPHIETRMWNPFARSKSACRCINNDQCSCCFDLPLLSDKGCLVSRADEKQIQYDLKIADVVVVSKTFPLYGRQEACARLPWPLNDLSACLSNNNIPITFGTSSCARLEFRVRGSVTAAMIFNCIDVRGGGRMAIGGFLDTNDAGRLALKVKAEYVKWSREIQRKAAAAKKAITKKWDK